MSEARKKRLIEQLFKVGNLNHEFLSWLSFVLRIASQKYKGLTKEDFLLIEKEYGKEKYLPEVFNLYDSVFTETEIEEIFNFWSSPTGRKLVTGVFSEHQKLFHTKWAKLIETACQKLLDSRTKGINVEESKN